MSATELLLIAVLLLVDSLHFVFARLLLGLIPPAVSALYVLGIGTLEVGLWGLIRGRLNLGTLTRQVWFFLAVGFLVATSTNINYEAVALIDPGTASLLGKMSIPFGLGLGMVWLRDRLTKTQVVGMLVAVAGVFVVSFQPGDYLRLGSLLIVASAFMYALHAAIVKRHGGQIEFVDFFFFRLLCTTGFLFLFSLSRRALVWPSGPAWLLLTLTATVDVVVSRALYYAALRRSTLSMFNVVLTMSPVITVLWSQLLFDTAPSLQQLLGGATVLLGVLIVTVRAPK